jgi:hypothetical protein
VTLVETWGARGAPGARGPQPARRAAVVVAVVVALPRSAAEPVPVPLEQRRRLR